MTRSRCTKSTTPPCALTPFGFARQVHRHGHAQHLVHRDAIEVHVQQLVETGSSWYSLTSTRVSPAPSNFSEISVFTPECECRICTAPSDRPQRLGLAGVAAVEDGRDLALLAQPDCVVAAEQLSLDGFK